MMGLEGLHPTALGGGARSPGAPQPAPREVSQQLGRESPPPPHLRPGAGPGGGAGG